jgi:hypothetical protein
MTAVRRARLDSTREVETEIPRGAVKPKARILKEDVQHQLSERGLDSSQNRSKASVLCLNTRMTRVTIKRLRRIP